MKSLIFTIFILVTFNSFGLGKSAFVNVTLPASSVQNGTSLSFTLDAYDPVPPSSFFENMKFGFKIPSGAFSELVSYNRFNKKLVIKSPLPSLFAGRIDLSIVNKTVITVKPVLFKDEKSEFYFELDYYNSGGTKLTLDSKKLLLQNVFSVPSISSPSKANVVVIEGVTSTLTCIVRSRPVSSITWSYNQLKINGTPSISTTKDGDITIVTGTLTIPKPSMSIDGEQVTCSAKHQFSAAVNHTFTVNVQYRPKNTTLTISPLNPRLNQMIQLTCKAVGKPSVSKYKFYVNETSIGNSTTGSLNVTANDCGKYNGYFKCIPESAIGDGETASQFIVVTDDVRVTTSFASRTANESQNVTLSCSVTGCPLPTISWIKDGSSLNRFGSSLMLNSVSKATAGQYSCHAANGYTNASAQIVLGVNYKPMSTKVTASSMKPVENTSLTFNCSTDSFPTANYKFYHVNGSGDVLVSSSGSETSGLYSLPSVIYSGAYNVTYKCVPYNMLGDGEAKTVTVEIQVRPRITISVVPSTINETQNATVECRISAANPSPPITITNPKGQSVVHTQGRLSVSNATADQNGRYTCTANNGVGSTVTVTTSLVVNHTPDQVNVTPSSAKPVTGSSVTLTCSARATPTAHFRFYQVNGSIVTQVQDSSSAIYTTGALNYESLPNYKAMFRCVPYNMIGNGIYKDVTLDIQVPPKISVVIAPRNVNESGNAIISCNVIAANPPATINLTNPSRQSISHANGVAALSNLTREDAGNYSCIATNGVAGSPITKSASLSVNHPPDQVKFTAVTTTPMEGTPAMMTCSARATPTANYKYYFLNGTFSLVYDGPRGTYKTLSLTYKETTNYKLVFRCVPYNFLGSGQMKELTIDIQVPPVLSVSITPKIIAEFGNATFECRVDAANPPATISIRNPQGQIVPHVNGTATLTNITREGSGAYSCIASNNVTGSPVTKSTMLTVNHKPDQVNLTVSDAKPTNGASVIFRCTSRAHPVAHYKFYSVIGSSVSLLQNTSSPSFTIASIDHADFVGYKATIRCIPYNALGDGSAIDTTVDIQVSPEITASPAMVVNEGQTVDLKCNVTHANPMPTITWKDPANNVLSPTNGLLRLQAVARNRSGIYSCQASNGIGTQTKTTSLTIHYGPEITSKNTNMTACKPGSVTITCNATGHPTPTVRIILANKEMGRGLRTATYRITDLADNTFGDYSCKANNSVKEVAMLLMTLTKKAAPGVVTDVKLTGGKGSIDVTWKLPLCTGASGIKEIRVKYRNKGDNNWMVKTAKSSDSKLSIDGLDSGKEYDIQVVIVDGSNKEYPALQSSQRTATSETTTGSNAALIGGIIGGLLLLFIIIVVCVAFSKRRQNSSTVIPSEPLHFSIQSLGCRKILVKWDAPKNVNLNEINHYDIYWKLKNGSEEVKSVKGSAGSFMEEIDGLKSGLVYEFRIAAVMSNGSIGRCSFPKVQRTDSEYRPTGLSNGAYGDNAGKKSEIGMKEMNGDDQTHYRAPDGSVYATVSKKDKSKVAVDGAVDNKTFIADSDGAYEPVANNNATPKQSPAPNKKAEGTYAELSTFQSPNGVEKPKEQPAKTEYATLEEMGPLTPYEKPSVVGAKDDEEPPTHKITVAPEPEEVTTPERAASPDIQVSDSASDTASTKVDII